MVKVVNKGMLDIKHEEFREWLSHESNNHIMMASIQDKCPLIWFLRSKGYPVRYVSLFSAAFDRYDISLERDILELYELPEWCTLFVRHLDKEFSYKQVSQADCLQILNYWMEGLV